SASETARSCSAGSPRTISPPTAPQPKPRIEIGSPVRPKLRISIDVLPRSQVSRQSQFQLRRSRSHLQANHPGLERQQRSPMMKYFESLSWRRRAVASAELRVRSTRRVRNAMKIKGILERAMGFEPTTPTLARLLASSR